jgi:hypothetical protein
MRRSSNMARRSTFTLRGEAAGEYVRAQGGALPQDDDERAMRVATLVHVQMLTGDEKTARALIKLAAREGLEAAAKACTAIKETGT